tara:strand:+ start:55 stop:1536 length:1482 start_codon:yes stop_codon:yes gene_type:complete
MRFIGKDPNIIDAYYTATAEGAITAGKPVIVEADGDVAQVVLTALTTPTVSSRVAYESGVPNQVGIAYDENSERVVIAYADGGNSSYGTAVVGSISGTTLSFGTPVVYKSSNPTKQNTPVFDPDNNKVVIAYQWNNANGYAIVGTVDPSDNSISFGSEAQFESNQAVGVSMTYDKGADKFIIFWSENGDAECLAVTGTVSGTSISFGSEVQVDAQNHAKDHVVSVAYNENANKTLFTWRNDDNINGPYTGDGTSRVGTVSGTSISVGTTKVWGEDDSLINSIYVPGQNKILIVYRDDNNSYYGTARVATISGTSVSLGTAAVFESAETGNIALAVNDSDTSKVIITYTDNGDSNRSVAVLATVSGTSVSFGSTFDIEGTDTHNSDVAMTRVTGQNQAVWAGLRASHGTSSARVISTGSTNLTSENYIGIAADTYADNEDSTIGIVGCIDRNQTGLTAGQQYFVQTDGTLSTTAGSPSVLAGTAISATELVVKE